MAEERGTGRTNRMLQKALAGATGGLTVIVMGSDDKHCKDMMHMLRANCSVPQHAQFHLTNREVSLWPQGQIRFKSVLDQDWDPKMERVMGYPAGVPVFIDHSTDPKAKLKGNPALNSTKESPNTSKTSDNNSGEPLKR